MSNPDSFIDEVTEAVRRDRLYGLFRRFGWIGIVLVLALVGAAAWTEWTKARDRAAGQAFGDAVLAALDAPDPAARAAALGGVEADGAQVAVLALMQATDPATDRAGALAALDRVAGDGSLPQIWRDLAVLRRVIVAGAEQPAADRRAALGPLTEPGRPFRPLALEQMAYLQVEAGETEPAIEAFRALTVDQGAPAGLRQRAAQMIVALGGSLDAG